MEKMVYGKMRKIDFHFAVQYLYPKFGNARARARESYGEMRFLSAIRKIQFLSDRDEIFFSRSHYG